MTLEQYYEKNKAKIAELLPNCSKRFMRFLDLCWKNRLYFVIPRDGGKRTENDQLLLLTQGRTYEQLEKNYRSFGLNLLQLQKIKNIYVQNKNLKGGKPVTWTYFSKHLEGRAIDCLPLSGLELEKDGRKSRVTLQTMELLAKENNIGVFRPVETFIKGDFAHFEAFDKPIELSKEAQNLINKRNERIKQRLSTTP